MPGPVLNKARIIALSRDAIAQILPGEASAGPDLIDVLTTAVMTFTEGVYVRLLVGERTVSSVEELERFLHAIVTAVAFEYAGKTATARRKQRP